MRAALALAEASLRQSWNRRWRFSRFRSGLWLLLLRVGLAGVVFWRLRGDSVLVAPGTALTAIALQFGVWSFLMVFLAGRNRLFTHPAVRLVLISPAPSWSPIAAQVRSALPGRTWSALVWAGALAQLLPPETRWWTLPALWATAVLAGSLAELTGLWALVAWVRVAPRSLGVVWAAVLVIQLGLLYYVIYLLVSGEALARVGQSLASLRWWLGGGLVLLLGFPGLAMLLWLIRSPGRIGGLYREAWLNLAEADGDGSRSRRSRWPALLPGAAGAIQARDWLCIIRNPFTLLRAGVVVLGTAALVPFGPVVAEWAAANHDLAVLGTGVGLVFFAFGELGAAGITMESDKFGLHLVSGVRPGSFLLGKLAAACPFSVLTAGVTWAVARAAGDPLSTQAVMAFRGGLTGLGMTCLMVGLAALDASSGEAAEQEDREGLSMAAQQVPLGPFSIAGFLIAGCFGAAAVWGDTLPWPAPVLWVLPVAALLLGYLKVWWLLRRGG